MKIPIIGRTHSSGALPDPNEAFADLVSESAVLMKSVGDCDPNQQGSCKRRIGPGGTSWDGRARSRARGGVIRHE